MYRECLVNAFFNPKMSRTVDASQYCMHAVCCEKRASCFGTADRHRVSKLCSAAYFYDTMVTPK